MPVGISINPSSGLLCFGGTDGNRTSDTRIFSPLLYQLSYGTSVFAPAKVRHFSESARKKMKKV